MMYSDVQWCTVMYSYVQWWTVMYSDVQWSTVMYSDVQWWTVMYTDVQWCTVMYSDVQWCTVKYSDVQVFAGKYNSVHLWALYCTKAYCHMTVSPDMLVTKFVLTYWLQKNSQSSPVQWNTLYPSDIQLSSLNWSEQCNTLLYSACTGSVLTNWPWLNT